MTAAASTSAIVATGLRKSFGEKVDGARMDKLTYAGLKGMGADLSNVTIE